MTDRTAWLLMCVVVGALIAAPAQGQSTRPDSADAQVAEAMEALGLPAKPDTDKLLDEWRQAGRRSPHSPAALALALLGEPRAAVEFVKADLAYRQTYFTPATRPGPEPLEEALFASQPLLRIAALHGLAGVRAALDSDDEQIARQAAVMIADSADPQIVTFLLDRLKAGKLTYEPRSTGPGEQDCALPVSVEASRDVLLRQVEAALAATPADDDRDASAAAAISLLRYIAKDPTVRRVLERVPAPTDDRRAGYRTAYQAAVALVPVNPDRAVALLKALILLDGNTDGSLVEALNEIPGQAATEALVAGLNARSGWISNPCRQAVIERADMAAVPALLANLRSAKELNPPCWTLVKLLWELRAIDQKQSNPSATDWPGVERQIVAALTPALDDRFDRQIAAMALGTCSKELAVGPLLAALGKYPGNHHILKSLAELGAAEAIPLCVKLARTSDVNWIRANSIEFLAAIKAPQAVEICLEALGHHQPVLRASAAWGLAIVGHKDAADKVFAALATVGRQETEGRADALVACIGADRALDLMRKWAGQDGGVDEHVIKAAAADQRKRCVELLMKDLERLSHSYGAGFSDQRGRVAGLLVWLKADEAVPVLTRGLGRSGWPGPDYTINNDLVFKLLGDLGTPAAIDAVKTWAGLYHVHQAAPQLVRHGQRDTFNLILDCQAGPLSWRYDPQTLCEAMRLARDERAARDQLAGPLFRSLGPKAWKEYLAGGLHDSGTILCCAEALDLAGDERGVTLAASVAGAAPGGPWREPRDAIRLLGRLRHPAAGAALRSLLDDPRRSVRALAAGQLGRLRDRDAIPMLKAMLAHPDATLQFAAAEALKRVESPGEASPAAGPEKRQP